MRSVSLDLVSAPTAECRPPSGESFGDTLEATRRADVSPPNTRRPAPADTATRSDHQCAPTTEGGDLTAAAALLGSLMASLCAPPAPSTPQSPVVWSDFDQPLPSDGEPPTVVAPTAWTPAPMPDATAACIGARVDLTAPTPAAPATPTPTDDIRLPASPQPPPTAPPPPAPAQPLFATVGAPASPAVPPPIVVANASPKPPPIDHERVATPPADHTDLTGAPTPSTAATAAASATATAGGTTPHAGEQPDASRGHAAIEASAIAAAPSPPSQVASDSDKPARPVTALPAVVCDLAEQARVSSPRRVVIPLDPPALGHVTVEIIVRADSVKVSLQHGDDAAFASLNAQRPAIAAALESNGLHLSGFDVSSNQQRHAAPGQRTARHFETFVDVTEPDGALRL